MNIVVVTRCLNGKEYIERFVKGYSFASLIVVSDGGSSDGSLETWNSHPEVEVVPFPIKEIHEGHEWNPDSLHIQHAIDEGLKHKPDWIILDDLDDVPNQMLRENARHIMENCLLPQINAFRLYMWGDKEYFPKMNNWFHPSFRSLWAWKPSEITIETDKSERHGTLVGLTEDYHGIEIPMCLLHKSWHPLTVREKMKRYNAIGMPMHYPTSFAGEPEILPEWAVE